MKTFGTFLVASLLISGVTSAQPAPAEKGKWVDISAPVIAKLDEAGKKIGYPGKTTGVAVDRTTGDVLMIVPDQGVWKSSDKGATFERIDGGKITGRCETSFTINFDPAGKRWAFFMLDGTGGITLDAGKTWYNFKGVGRNWDCAAVAWSQEEPKDIFAMRHESGGEAFTSTSGGRDWKQIGKDVNAVGLFDANSLLCMHGKGGIERSTDGGATWKKVSDSQPTGRVMCVFSGVGYWLTKDGLMTSKDKGETWALLGTKVDASVGPFFGENEKHIVVGGTKGIFETKDAGQTWERVTGFPPKYTLDMPGWFVNIAWDPKGDVFYVSKMGMATMKYER